MTEIIEGIYFIAGVDDMIPDSHVYVIGEPSSKDLSIIDAGLMGKGNYKVQTIKKTGIQVEDIKRIIMTHTHLDHIGCLKEIRETPALSGMKLVQKGQRLSVQPVTREEFEIIVTMGLIKS